MPNVRQSRAESRSLKRGCDLEPHPRYATDHAQGFSTHEFISGLRHPDQPNGNRFIGFARLGYKTLIFTAKINRLATNRKK